MSKIIYPYIKQTGESRKNIENHCAVDRFFIPTYNMVFEKDMHPVDLAFKKGTQICLLNKCGYEKESLFGLPEFEPTHGNNFYIILEEDTTAVDCCIMLFNAYMSYCKDLDSTPFDFSYCGFDQDENGNVEICLSHTIVFGKEET